jgi:hypothetical protein
MFACRFSMVAFMHHCGDYDIQQGLVEILIRLAPAEERYKFASEMFDWIQSPDIADVFQYLGTSDFENVRLSNIINMLQF